MGFVQWRVAFYVAGNPETAVENFFCLLDDFFTFKSKALAKDIEIHVRPHKSAAAEVTSLLVESLSYEHLTFHEAAAEAQLPLKIFEAQPVVGKRVVTLFVQPESGTHVSVLFGGNTWNFRSALDEAGVKGLCFCNPKFRSRGPTGSANKARTSRTRAGTTSRNQPTRTAIKTAAENISGSFAAWTSPSKSKRRLCRASLKTSSTAWQ